MNDLRDTLFWVMAGLLFSGCRTDIIIPKKSGDSTIENVQDLQIQARLSRPTYFSQAGDGKRIQVVADADHPVYASMGDKLYHISAPIYADLNQSGAGGVDEGHAMPQALYFVYAVPDSTMESSFALVVSEHRPDVGPSGFGVWTYLGGAVTRESSTSLEFLPCSKSGDIISVEGESFALSNETVATVTLTPRVPEHTRAVFFKLSVTGSYFTSPAKLYNPGLFFNANILTVSGDPFRSYADFYVKDTSEHVQFGWLPLLSSRQIVLEAAKVKPDIFPATTTRAQLVAWIEDVSQFP